MNNIVWFKYIFYQFNIYLGMFDGASDFYNDMDILFLSKQPVSFRIALKSIFSTALKFDKEFCT